MAAAVDATAALPVFEFVLKDASSADERYLCCGHSFGTQFASVIVAHFAAKEGVTNMLRIKLACALKT